MSADCHRCIQQVIDSGERLEKQNERLEKKLDDAMRAMNNHEVRVSLLERAYRNAVWGIRATIGAVLALVVERLIGRQ